MDFSLEEALLWIMDSYFGQKWRFKVKMSLFFTNMQLFTSHDINWWMEWCGLLVDYCEVFISCLDSYSDGTHSLQRIHWWPSHVMLHFSKSDEETNSSTSWMAWWWVHFQQIFIFGWTIPLRQLAFADVLQAKIRPKDHQNVYEDMMPEGEKPIRIFIFLTVLLHSVPVGAPRS